MVEWQSAGEISGGIGCGSFSAYNIGGGPSGVSKEKTPLPSVSIAGAMGANGLAYRDVADVRGIQVVVLVLVLINRGIDRSVTTSDSLIVRYLAKVRLGEAKVKHLGGISHFPGAL